jgi:putative sterol carrier protein
VPAITTARRQERRTTVVTSARELFTQIPAETRGPEFDGWHGSYKFDIADQGVWTARVDDGVAVVHEGDVPTDCVIHCDNDEFLRIVSGEQNMLTAWMQGRIDAEGDIALLQHFHGFIRSDERIHREV